MNKSKIAVSVSIIAAICSVLFIHFSQCEIAFFSNKLIFAAIWCILYIFMGAAAFKICKSKSDTAEKAMSSYYLLLMLSCIWFIVFFIYSIPVLSVTIILLLLTLSNVCMIFFMNIHKKAGFVMLAYEIWVAFCVFLNMYTFML